LAEPVIVLGKFFSRVKRARWREENRDGGGSIGMESSLEEVAFGLLEDSTYRRQLSPKVSSQCPWNGAVGGST